jgi:hypothetical protein
MDTVWATLAGSTYQARVAARGSVRLCGEQLILLATRLVHTLELAQVINHDSPCSRVLMKLHRQLQHLVTPPQERCSPAPAGTSSPVQGPSQ